MTAATPWWPGCLREPPPLNLTAKAPEWVTTRGWHRAHLLRAGETRTTRCGQTSRQRGLPTPAPTDLDHCALCALCARTLQ